MLEKLFFKAKFKYLTLPAFSGATLQYENQKNKYNEYVQLILSKQNNQTTLNEKIVHAIYHEAMQCLLAWILQLETC